MQMSFIMGLIGKFLHVHPLTAKTKTFGGGVAAVGACVVAIGTLMYGGDTQVIHYIYPVIGALVSLGQIFHRDGLTKLANTLQGLLPKQ
jgi:hypothetical protein